MNPRLPVLMLAIAALGGCSVYDSVDAQGPPRDFSGVWIAESSDMWFLGDPWFRVRQEGSRLRVQLTHEEREGEARGRVAIWTNQNGFVRHGMTLSADERSALRRDVFWTTTFFASFPIAPLAWPWALIANAARGPSTCARAVVGPSAMHAADSDPALKGGLLCRLPARPDGTLADEFEPLPPLREYLAFLQHSPNRRGDAAATVAVFAVDEPRKCQFLRLPAYAYPAAVFEGPEMRRARRAGPLCRQETVTLDGKPAWIATCPAWEEGATTRLPARLVAEVYRVDPDRGAWPVEVVTVATRSAVGEWQSQPAPLKTSNARVEVVLERGGVARIELR
jgi:hypothetical protein